MIMMHYVLLMQLLLYEDKKKKNLLIVKPLLCRFVIPILFLLFNLIFLLQMWLFGYEMHDVLVVFCQDTVILCASAKKIAYLKQVN